MSFLRSEAQERLKDSPLVQAFSLIDWEFIRDQLGKLGRSGYGPNGYAPINLLKALILQSWHSLSDEGLEEALRVRLDFMVVTSLEKVPDHTTLCRFRNLLMSQNLWDKVLNLINHQLEEKGLKVKHSQGAIVDATLISSAARPRKEMEGIAIDRQEEENHYRIEEQEKLSKDPDASWLKKGKRSYFGYKGFMIVDQEDGYIDQVHVTPAHVSEVSELKEIIKDRKDKRLYGDKGYASQSNKEILRAKKTKNGLMEKAKRNKPLSSWQKVFNRMISKIRYRIEQGFGTLKRRFKFSRAAYFTTLKVQGQMALKAIAFNLLKASNKVSYG